LSEVPGLSAASGSASPGSPNEGDDHAGPAEPSGLAGSPGLAAPEDQGDDWALSRPALASPGLWWPAEDHAEPDGLAGQAEGAESADSEDVGSNTELAELDLAAQTDPGDAAGSSGQMEPDALAAPDALPAPDVRFGSWGGAAVSPACHGDPEALRAVPDDDEEDGSWLLGMNTGFG
jgi:hypothetical protein